MNKSLHRVYIVIMVSIVILVFVALLLKGSSYYKLGIEDRYFHEQHNTLKPNGFIGHGLGIIGSFFMLAGVSLYMLRKRIRKFSRVGILKHWLEFHIFLCTMGPIMVLFHTSFKFGGLVAISFWSMVAVVASGVIGRFIYLQIPRTIEGKELSRMDLEEKKAEMNLELREKHNLHTDVLQQIQEALVRRPDREGGTMFSRFIIKYKFENNTKHQIKNLLKGENLSRNSYRSVSKLLNEEISMARKIDRLVSMQTLFQYWHVAHLPFALIMLVIMIVHVVVAITFGYTWIF